MLKKQTEMKVEIRPVLVFDYGYGNVKTYRSVRGAVDAWADAFIYPMLGDMNFSDSESYDEKYDALKKKAIRRATPIFERVFGIKVTPLFGGK